MNIGPVLQPDGQVAGPLLFQLGVERVGECGVGQREGEGGVGAGVCAFVVCAVPALPGLDEGAFVAHLVAHGVAEDGDEDGGEGLAGAELGGFDVGV